MGSDSVTSLKAEFENLRSFVLSRRSVDLIDWGDIKIFMYTDDLAYQSVQDVYKNKAPGKALFTKPALQRRSPHSVYDNPGATLVSVLLSHYWLNNLPFVYLDVGCQYGSSSILIAQLIQSCGYDNRVVAFEPGVAGSLVPFNLRINHLADKIRFEPLAVTDGSYPTILYAELGHSENNRIVNRDEARESISYVVDSTSIDDYLRVHAIAEHLILKVDTQGAEVEVVQGMENAIADRNTSLLMEFTPWALESRVDPAKWLMDISERHQLLDTGGQECFITPLTPLRLIPNSQFRDFVKGVRERPQRHTDLLLLPRNLPNIEKLLARLTSLAGR